MRRLALLVLMALIAGPLAVWAETVIWDAGFNATPAGGAPVSEGDDRIRELKTAVNERGDTEHAWDSVGGDTAQTGRHRVGSARAFHQDAAPATLTVNDADASAALDDGRFWVETDPDTARTQPRCCARLMVRDESNTVGAGAGWTSAVAVPKNAIILWDQTTGDENCDGVMVADQCPCGFAAEAAFAGLTIRGVDTAAADGDIPDDAGINCSGGGAGVGCGAPGATNYDDSLTTDEIPSHTHSVALDSHTNDADADFVDRANNGGDAIDYTSGATGGDEDHFHPFRSVLFCKAL